MKLVIGSYILDGVSSTAYEEFLTYYSQTAASYITASDIERWNTPADLGGYADKTYVTGIKDEIISYITDNEKVTAAGISYVKEMVEGIEMPDLNPYATKSYVIDTVSSFSFDIDTEGLVNESRMQDYVTGAIAGHSSSAYNMLKDYTDQKVDGLNITSYATKDWVTEHITEIATGGTVTLDGYATEIWVNSQGFLKQPDLNNYVTQSIMSAALNSYMKKSDMLTYATKNYVDNAILQAATGDVDLSMYALKSEIPSLSNYYNKQWIDANMASKSYVTAKVVEIASGGEITLDGYATESWVQNRFVNNNALSNYYTKLQVENLIPDMAGYITQDWIEGYYNQYVKDYCDTFNTDAVNLLNYVSKEELASLGYITSHQDLSAYATNSYVTGEINRVMSYIEENEKVTAAAISYVNEIAQSVNSIVIPEVDLGSYATKAELSSYATISYVTDKFAEDENVWAAAITDINTRMSSYISAAEITQIGYVTANDLSQMGYITINDIPQPETIDLSSYATSSYVTGEINRVITYIEENEKVTAGAISYLSYKIDSIGTSGSGPAQDLSDYATKAYVNSYYLPLTGGTLTGDIKFSDGNAVIGDKDNLVNRAYIANLGMDFTNGIRIYDTASNNTVRIMIFQNRIVPNHNNYMKLGVSTNAWAAAYTYNYYTYSSSGWYNVSETLAGLETLLSQI